MVSDDEELDVDLQDVRGDFERDRGPDYDDPDFDDE
jgi:hypothetical protein